MDQHDQVRDFYYPYVGQENHVQGNIHRTGIWVDNKFNWLSDKKWKKIVKYKKETLVSDVKAVNKELKVELNINEFVHHRKNIFLRKMVVKNLSDAQHEVRVFFNQHFHIAGANIGDTAFYDPTVNSLIHYKGRRYFLINGVTGGQGMNDYATGLSEEKGLKGTYVDAVDGTLSKNPIEHGSVDSTISFSLNLKPGASKTIHYWITVGKKFKEVIKLNKFILNRKPEQLLKDTEKYWRKWVNRRKIKFEGLSNKVVDLFKRSLLIIRTQTDNGGAIIAANDSDTLYFKKDNYSYMWPRDGALIARALDRSGYKSITNRFFIFCGRILSDEGYLLPKYRPDRSVGSSWHSWLKEGNIQLPIQEDETALVLDALWKKFKKFGNKPLMRELYKPFTKRAGNFLASFRDEKTGLPKESYDLWEEKLGVHTFTCCTVYAGLTAAHNFAKLFGTKSDANKYFKAAQEVRSGILTHLYDEGDKTFIKGLYTKKGEVFRDKTIDSSSGYGVFEYKVLDVNDERVTNTIKLIEERLHCNTSTGGYARYLGDNYFRVNGSVPGNPWFVPTLWLAEYYIAKATNQDDLKPAVRLLEWATKKALSSGILSEQLHPYNGKPLSVAPLTWSHAGFVITVIKYLDALERLGICKPYK